MAALLARQGNSVVVLARESTNRAIAAQGLRVESARFGDFQVDVRSAVRLEDEVDACLITVKSTQLKEALERVPPGAVAQSLMVPFLNGIDHVDVIRDAFPGSATAAATIRIEAARAAPGLILQTSPFATVELAAEPSTRDDVQALADQLSGAGLDVRVRDDETAMLWDKLVFLAPLALLTTHERANVGEIRTRCRTEALAVISEVAAVAQAEGAAVDPGAVTRLLDSVPATMESSMQRDQASGLPLELDAIGGAVVRRAAKLGVAVPVTARLVEELGQRGSGSVR